MLAIINGLIHLNGIVMAKAKVDKTNAMRALDQLKLEYEALSYPCAGDEVLGAGL